MINKSQEEIMKNWVGDINSPLVSIKCTAYNHERFIRDALDGFLMQETTFPFEVIVHDDASTDNTASIIKEYEKKYPLIIKPIYEKENQYSKHDGSLTRIINKQLKGKYVAFCEGDDYWIDNNKIKLQKEYFENNNNCSLIITNGYDENYISKKRTTINPYNVSCILDAHQVIKENGQLPPTCSMMCKKEDYFNMPDFFNDCPVGDRPLRFYLITKGYAYYMQEKTCVHVSNVKGSFSERSHNNEYADFIYRGMCEFFDNYNNYTNYMYKDEIEFVKNRELFVTFLRKGQKKEAIKTQYYKETRTLYSKVFDQIVLHIPKEIKEKIKGIINGK